METKIVSGEKRRQETEIANSIKSSDNPSQCNSRSNYWSALNDIVEEPADNTYIDFSHVLQNKLATEKPNSKVKSPPDHKKYQSINGVLKMEKKVNAMLLEFEEINSTISKYLSNIESGDDEELLPI